jgi:transcription initiation factor IIE alpha subunit
VPAQNHQTTTYPYRQCSEHLQREHEEKLYKYKKRSEGESAVETTTYYPKYHSVGAALAMAAVLIIDLAVTLLTCADKVMHMLP